MGKYNDIIDLPHHESKTHSQMSMIERAAQFSPFAALTGYEDAIDEAARLTEDELDLSEGSIQEINDKICFLMEHLSSHPIITIMYFVPDERKAGGRYRSVTGEVKKIRTFEQEIELADGTTVAIKRILSIDSELFNQFDMQ